MHSHDTAGIAAATMIAAAVAGADVVDVAIDSEYPIIKLAVILMFLGMSGVTSQPSMGAVCMALEQTTLGTGIRYADIQALNLYWSQVRQLYSCFEANVRASDSSVFDHEMPGGQYTNLMVCVFPYPQFYSLHANSSSKPLSLVWVPSGLKSRRNISRPINLWVASLYLYLQTYKTLQCGDIIKVTPSSKVVGDFAQWMTSNSLSAAQVKEQAENLDFPSSVVEFFQGYLGQPYGGFPEPLRTHIIRNKPRVDGRPGASMQPMDFKKIKADLRAKFGKHITDVDVMSYAMYPKVFEEYQGFVERYGDLSILPTRYFLGRPEIGEEMNISIEKGKMLIIRLMAIGAVTEGKGTRDVWFEVNGEVRAVPVEDKSAAVDTVSRERATSDPGSVGAPMSGVVVEVRVKEGQEVKKGDIVCVQSAMKVNWSHETRDRADDLIDGKCRLCSCIRTRQTGRCPRRRFVEPRRFGSRNRSLTGKARSQPTILLPTCHCWTRH